MIINDNLQQSAGFTGQDEALFPSVSLMLRMLSEYQSIFKNIKICLLYDQLLGKAQ